MFQVPQFIEVESKILGPLSLRQFLIIGGVFIFGALLYFVMQKIYWIMLMVFLVSVASGLTFVKINGQPLIKFSAHIFSYFWQPRYYIWKKEEAKIQTPRIEILKLRPLALNKESALALLFLKLKTGDNRLSPRLKNGSAGMSKLSEGYEIVRKVTGDRELARRVDFRY